MTATEPDLFNEIGSEASRFRVAHGVVEIV
jgi:hypothetical protein